MLTTDIDAWILALLPNASLTGPALFRNEAFRSALVGLAEEAWLALADHPGADHLADGMGSTWIGVARAAGLVSYK